MSDLIGKTLGSYRILEPIGVGGMATVYKAYQPGMDRLVAIKVLPPHLLQDEQFAKRFQREAQAITWLEHPHILPIYDYGEVEGITYLAMRYVDAGTLKQRIAKGPLPLDEVSRIIGQIGDALDYAHRMGIIHRDVKPANVLMDDRGNTYLTDFGLARMMETSDQLTASGVGVGTPAYMSPEQGQGVKVDHRSDIYSLGVVLYEMVTGHVPFEAETPMAVVLKHISEPLPLPRTVAPCVPEPVERIILKALAKDPAHRYQTAGEMVQALTIAVRKVTPEALQQPVEGELGIGELGKGREDTSLVTRIQRTWQQPRGKVMLIGGAIIVAALVVLLSQLPGQVQIVSETVPTVAPDATATSAAVAVAPTQKPTTAPVSAPVAATAPTKPCRILSVDQQEGYLFAQDCDGSNWRKLTDPPVWVQWPSWSPDGQRIVFESNPSKPVPGPNPTSLYIVNADGSGLTRLITARGGVYQSSWSPDGSRIAFAQDCNLFTIGPDGSNRVMLVDSQKLSRAGDSELCTHAPMWSSDSRRISFTAFFPQDSSPGPYEHRIYLVNADGSGLTELLSFKMKDRTPPGTHALWSPDGNQVAFAYEVEGKYRSYRMNVDGSGKPEEIESIPDSWSPTHWPQWDRDVQTAAATLAPAQPCRNLYEDQEKEYDLFVRDCDGSHTRRLTEHRTFGHSFSWSPDGQRIIFDATFGSKPPPTSIYIINADGSNRTQLLTGGEGGFGNPSWSPNGERIAYMERCNIMTIRLDGSDMVTIVQRQDLMNHKGDPDMCLWEPVWSPDSRRIALTAQELNPPPNAPSARRVAVVNADGTGLIDVAAFDLNQQGGVRPVCWSPDGQQIAYLVWDGQVAKRYLVNADGSGKSAEIDSIPEVWCPTHWPQWDRTPQAPPVGTQAEQARAFAEPILNAIANRPPDYQDDFSDPKSGWPSGSTPGGDKWGYEDNAYFFSATYRPQGGCCGAAPARALAFSDFILEVDGQFISGERSSWYVILRHTDNAQYGMGLSLDGDLRMWKNVQGVHQDLGGTHLANFEKGEGVNHLVVIARGSQIAIYVNGRPAWFVYDESSSRGEMSLGVGNEAHGTTLRVRFDNFKVWDISKPPTTAKAHPMDLSVDSTAGCRVKINGVLRPAEGPWSWDWGDGTETVGYFPQEHTFLKSGAYTVRVTASNGISDALSLKLACP